jgi:hypothetical protein
MSASGAGLANLESPRLNISSQTASKRPKNSAIKQRLNGQPRLSHSGWPDYSGTPRITGRCTVQAFRWVGWLFLVMGAFFVGAAIVGHGHGLGIVLPFSTLGATFLIIGLAFVGVARSSRASEAARAVVLATGLRGSATITDIAQTGTLGNENPQCRIAVNVSLPDRLIYQATITEVIRRSAMPRYVIGAKFPAESLPTTSARSCSSTTRASLAAAPQQYSPAASLERLLCSALSIRHRSPTSTARCGAWHCESRSPTAVRRTTSGSLPSTRPEPASRPRAPGSRSRSTLKSRAG